MRASIIMGNTHIKYKLRKLYISHLKWRHEKLNEVPSEFSFLTREKLFSMNTSDLCKAVNDLAHEYSDEVRPVEISSEIVLRIMQN